MVGKPPRICSHAHPLSHGCSDRLAEEGFSGSAAPHGKDCRGLSRGGEQYGAQDTRENRLDCHQQQAALSQPHCPP